MKSNHYSKRQRGFFDLGMSLLVLALAGGFIYGAETSPADEQSFAAVQDAQHESTVAFAEKETVVAEAAQ